ncbi:MAG: sulfotransferase, partial [Alphaproteobacteria bacterium]
LKRVTFGYSASDVAGYFATLKRITTAEFLQQRRRGDNGGAAPIFILGMPRSGTTLVEQMIASHPAVTGAGELEDLPRLIQREVSLTSAELPDGLAELDREALERIARAYQERINGLAGDKPHVTDKTPHNFLNVGLIRAILPSARIIHVRRDPMDTCFSIYATYFSAPHYYAWDLEELGAYYREYQGLMDHWRSVDPDAMCEVDYEKLIADPEGEITRLLEWCGLEFSENCLAYDKNARPVRTASAAQVRRPLYTSSVKRWRHFAEHLQPLEKALAG